MKIGSSGADRQDVQKKLGAADSEDLRSRSTHMRQVPGRMRVIAFIHDQDVIRKILEHLNLWDVKRKPFPRLHAPSIDGFSLYDEPPAPGADEYLTDPDYPAEAYF